MCNEILKDVQLQESFLHVILNKIETLSEDFNPNAKVTDHLFLLITIQDMHNFCRFQHYRLIFHILIRLGIISSPVIFRGLLIRYKF